jgi:ribosomal protein S6--L-glutamate ligase
MLRIPQVNGVIPYFVSFNPDVKSEVNLPLFQAIETREVQELLKKSTGAILPSYVPPWRYRTIVGWARRWFPRLDARFEYCGKIKQILLFRRMNVRHPESLLFRNPMELMLHFETVGFPWGYPLVLKGDSGGGGQNVYPIYTEKDLAGSFDRLPGQEPALVQQFIQHGGMDLRVVVYGDHAVSYFRVGDGRFYNNVCRGGRIDYGIDPDLQRKGINAVKGFCRRSNIDIAGFDLMFPDEGEPVFIEINFHFGRKGLGGTAGHRAYVLQAVERWREKCLKNLESTPYSPGNSQEGFKELLRD